MINNSSFKKQWSKLMFYFYDYLPCKYEATKNEWAVRQFIWGFKDGKRSLQAAYIVAQQLRKQFGAKCKDIVFACIPASSDKKNEIRYKSFAEEVCRLTGCQNAYNEIGIDGERLAVHEQHNRKHVQGAQVITFNENFFRGKQVLIFDDIITQGFSYARFACQLEKFGAVVIGGYFLGRTLLR